MNIKAIAVAALVSVAMPAAVFAQSSTVDSTTAGVKAGSEMATSTMGAATDFNAFMQGFSGADFTNATSEIDSATSFNVVKLSTLQDADATQLKDAIAPKEGDIAGLTAKIDANAQAKAALDAEGLAPSDVVWIDADGNGAVTLYVNDLGTTAM